MIKSRLFIFAAAVFLTLAAAPLAGAAAGQPVNQQWSALLQNAEERLLDWKPITQAPGYHWFSYYDVDQFDPAGRYVLAMKVDFEGRQLAADDVIEIGMIDLQENNRENNRWQKLGVSRAWCWQQGCRLQWRPGSDREVLWNDREDGKFVCRILDVKSGKLRTLGSPIYHVSPDGKTALLGDFARVGWARPDYGYQGVADPYRTNDAPRESGVWKVDLESGSAKLLFSLADVAKIPSQGYTPGVTKGRQYFNHLSWSPDGSRFMVFHIGSGWTFTRMLVADPEGGHLRFITPVPSHYAWQDNDTILCYTPSAYRFFKVDGSLPDGTPERTLFVAPNGHQSFIPGTDWLLTDTYADSREGAERLQYVYLYHLKTGKKIIIGKFASPKSYSGIWRCDTHPRLSRDFTKVTIDSPHANGRQIYMADIGTLVGKQAAGKK